MEAERMASEAQKQKSGGWINKSPAAALGWRIDGVGPERSSFAASLSLCVCVYQSLRLSSPLRLRLRLHPTPPHPTPPPDPRRRRQEGRMEAPGSPYASSPESAPKRAPRSPPQHQQQPSEEGGNDARLPLRNTHGLALPHLYMAL